MDPRKAETLSKPDRLLKEAASKEDPEIASKEAQPDESNPNEANPPSDSDLSPQIPSQNRNSRTPFTSLSQIDADLALARTLQEQERAYMLLRMGGAYDAEFEEGDAVDEEDGDYVDHDDDDDDDDGGEDAFDAQDVAAGIDPSAFDDDEAYARALQEAEARDLAARFGALNGINEWVVEEEGDDADSDQGTWSEVDPDELSYEELIALGEAVGTESRGLSHDRIAALPSVSYKAGNPQVSRNDQCVICQHDYDDGDSLVALSCKHIYHPDCINNWLQINKVCPICSAEVITPLENGSE